MRLRIVIVTGALLLALAATASAQFEGIADFTITMHGEKNQPATGTGKMYIARGAYRSEWETDLGSASAPRKDGSAGAKPQRLKMTIVGKRSDPDHMYMLNDERKTYSVMDMKKAREEAKDLPKETYTVQKLGGDTVAGLACQKAILTSSKGEVFEVCVSREWSSSSDWISAMSRNRGSGSWFFALKENGIEGYPVRLALRRKAGEEPFMVMVITHVERKSLPGSLFEVPPGYTQADTAMGGLTPEQEKAMRDARDQMKEALEKMSPEERKAYEDAMERYGQPTPRP